MSAWSVNSLAKKNLFEKLNYRNPSEFLTQVHNIPKSGNDIEKLGTVMFECTRKPTLRFFTLNENDSKT